MSEEPLYTVEEANALLPDLTRSLRAIRESRQVVLASGERLRRSAPRNGGGAVGREFWEALTTLRTELEAITERGIVLRDPERGLVDFPSRREGELVYLCWVLGEERVAFWHTTEAGFAGRRPL